MRTLWVEGSPKEEQSLSSSAAREFLASAPPDTVGEVTHFDVWSESAVSFSRDAALAKFAPMFGDELTTSQATAWHDVSQEIERVRGFDRLVVSSPMWNWHIPHALKQWIDVIVQPMLSFTLDEKGQHVGTLGCGKPCQLILTRSSAYDGRHPELQDFQQPYLEFVFGFLGYQVETLVVEPTTRWTEDERTTLRDEVLRQAREQGRKLTTPV